MSAIAERLGLHINTVNKYLRAPRATVQPPDIKGEALTPRK